jgi:hypothetical protein
MTTPKVFFDLEQTLIPIWDDPVPCNKEKVSKFLKDNDFFFVDIFSFAVWDDKDRQHFNTTMRSWIEREFKLRVDAVWTVDEIRRIVLKQMCAHFDHSEFLSLWGKKRAFEEFCEATMPDGTHTILVDDSVPNKVIFNKDRNLTIEFVNVDTL